MENTRRVVALQKSARKPRFALGAHVVDPWDEPGAVTAVYVNLAAAQDSGVVDKGWLSELAKKPTTPVTGHWYSVLCESGGAVLVGELDLRKAPKAKAKKAAATTTTKRKKKKKKKKAKKQNARSGR